MAPSLVPSTQLLRIFLRPSASVCTTCAKRSIYSNFMPRHKYAKVNRLDKLHRQQKVAMQQEKEDSQMRAHQIQELIRTSSLKVDTVQLPFHIGRTSTRNLPIYETVRHGGSKHITELGKLSGDLVELQKQLRAVLQLPEFTLDGKGRKKDPISINDLTQKITIKGWRGPEIKKWAEVLGF